MTIRSLVILVKQNIVKNFWDKINEQNRISNERYNREEQILTPTNEQLKKVFFIRK